ncbi:melatonin receptor type 1B-like [Octopus sinensis]|uniref:Melatonin receptor type 1B-like n=1 Tax=Octopus sinensis TaxID=2607531 RepID=A0A6P7T1Q0_9MOLL|nr:melatonin receptor type 1B-like [Octopus sinensis]XP_036364046.1 melatonin receptor type 1B-like [Octopus sinensis]
MELYDYTIYGLRNFYRTYKSSKYQQELYYYLLYITISLTVLLPNLLLVVVLLRKIKKGDTRPLDKLLLNICISSSLWGIFGHLVFAHLYYFRWNIGVAFCKVYYTVLVGFDIAFQFHMFAISIDRVLQATNPYRYLQRVNNFGSSLLLYIPWLGTVITVMPIYFLGFYNNSSQIYYECDFTLNQETNLGFQWLTFVLSLMTTTSTTIVIVCLLQSRGLMSYRLLTNADRQLIRSSLIAGIITNCIFASTVFILKCFHLHLMRTSVENKSNLLWAIIEIFSYLSLCSAGIIPTFWFIDRDIRNAITKQINEMVLKITRGSEKSETQKTIPIDFSDN